ncbi:glucuronyl esterase domain-containing protein [Parapedobacter sp. DT-150]|uniref:glucuronyl esterase domain-containing protein n=1 Tax=Parapedobacter sp. DT-150 TaxID=3396162 RepID=UPI003F1A11ED
MTKSLIKAVLSLLMLFAYGVSYSQPDPNQRVAGIPVNYDEAKAGVYTLPDPLTMENGRKVTSKAAWINQRRPEIHRLFETTQFGKTPPKPARLSFNVFDAGTPVFGGKAIRKQVTIYFTEDTADHKVDVLFYLPANAQQAVPLLLNISFVPNIAAAEDAGIKAGLVWPREGNGIERTLATKENGGSARWGAPIEDIVASGIGFATLYYGDIDPDLKKGIQLGGIRKYYLKNGQTAPAPDEWGAIAAWSWGLSRVMDYLETDSQIDAKRVALTGSSRLGKTVLWTGANDERFKMVLASCSGEGGAALSRRDYGENIKHMTDTSRYYYQFAPNRHAYSDDFNNCPVDAHELIALMAPRYLLLQTGDTDYWSDPKGEFLAARAAQPVYDLFGIKNAFPKMPKAGDTSLAYQQLGYYMHDGGHGMIPSDWDVFIKYMKRFL